LTGRSPFEIALADLQVRGDLLRLSRILRAASTPATASSGPGAGPVRRLSVSPVSGVNSVAMICRSRVRRLVPSRAMARPSVDAVSRLSNSAIRGCRKPFGRAISVNVEMPMPSLALRASAPVHGDHRSRRFQHLLERRVIVAESSVQPSEVCTELLGVTISPADLPCQIQFLRDHVDPLDQVDRLVTRARAATSVSPGALFV
jgi:hypothetical protein